MLRTHTYWWLLALLALALALASCGGTSSLDSGLATDNSPVSASDGHIPAIPQESGTPIHGVSAGGGTVSVLGKDFIQEFNGVVDGNSLHLEAGDNVAYGLYQFDGLAGKKPHTLSVQATPSLEGQYYVGLANYSTQNWQWFGPFTLPESEIGLGDSHDRYITELGNFYFLILSKSGQSCTHKQSTLSFDESTGTDERPAAPFDLSATDGGFPNGVDVTWSGGQGSNFFEVWRRLDQAHGDDEKWTMIGTTDGHEFFDETAVVDVWYRYKARGVNNVGSSEFSNIDKGYAGFNSDEWCPGELEASDGTSAEWVELNWNPGSGDVHNFHIWRRVDGGGDFEQIAETGDHFYHDTTAEPGVWYIYKVERFSEGESCFSNTDAGMRSATGNPWCPGEFTASDGTFTTGVKLEWGGGDGDGVFDVYRKLAEGGGDFALIADGLNVTSYFDETAEPGVVYSYMVFKRLGEEHCPTDADTGYRGVDGGTDWCPNEFAASDGTYEAGVQLEWNPGAGDGKFDVYRKVAEAAGEPTLLEDGLTGNSFLDTTAVVGTVYLYKVVKHWEGHDSCASNPDTGYRGDGGVGDDWCPTGLVATDGLYGEFVRTEWNPGTGTGFFDVWRKRDGEGFEWIKIGTTEDASFNDTNLDLHVVYIYKVVKHVNNDECVSNTDSGYAGTI